MFVLFFPLALASIPEISCVFETRIAMSSESSLKRFRKKADRIVLQPGSSSSSGSDDDTVNPPSSTRPRIDTGTEEVPAFEDDVPYVARQQPPPQPHAEDQLQEHLPPHLEAVPPQGEVQPVGRQQEVPDAVQGQDLEGDLSNEESSSSEEDLDDEEPNDDSEDEDEDQLQEHLPPHPEAVPPHEVQPVGRQQEVPDADQGQDSEGDSSNEESSSSEEDLDNEEPNDNSEDEDGQQQADAPIGDGHLPLYEGAPITLLESLTAIMTFVLTHALTGSCLVDLLVLIALHCPPNSRCVKSLFKLKKYFKDVGKEVLVCHYYCANCFELLQGKDSQCTQCKERTQQSYFIEIPLLYQLQMLFKRPGFYEDLHFRFNRQKKNPDNLEDIWDGNIYKDHVKMGFLDKPYHISFMWYSDGVSVFNFSNKFSIWPLYLVINELSYKKRVKRQNIILAGIWFGRKKPKVNTFLTPFHTKLAEFYRDGYVLELPDGNRIRVRGTLLCGTCDMPAKSCFLRWKHHNGYYGCFRCYTKGCQFEGASNVHVYPYEENVTLRKNEEVENYARVAIASGFPCYGIKGLSILYRMLLNMVNSTGIDAMHGAFSGVCKLLLELWFDSSFREMNFSLYHLIEIVDKRLLAFKVPSFLNKFPRSVKDLSVWKSLDFKVFLLYYSIPVLMGMMPDEYMEHHMLLVSGIYLLSQRSVSPEQVERAGRLLNKYVKEFQELYHLRFMSINIHQLVHYADVTSDLGPLWVFSCYFLEDLNGKICHLFHGTRYVGDQIASAATFVQKLSFLVENMNDESCVKNYCLKLQKIGKKFKVAEEIAPGIFVVGTSSLMHHPPLQVIFEGLGIRAGHFQVFHRLWMKGILYSSESYTRAAKRASTFIAFQKEGDSLLGSIRCFVRHSNCACSKVCVCQPAQHFCIIRLYRRGAWEAHESANDVSFGYMSLVHPEEQLIAVPISSIVTLCFHLAVEEGTVHQREYIVQRVNDLEAE